MAIGIKIAPPYAIIFMGDLEEQILQDCSFKHEFGGDTLTVSFCYGIMGKKN